MMPDDEWEIHHWEGDEWVGFHFGFPSTGTMHKKDAEAWLVKALGRGHLCSAVCPARMKRVDSRKCEDG